MWQEVKHFIKSHVKKILFFLSTDWPYNGSVYELNIILSSAFHFRHFSVAIQTRQCGTMWHVYFMHNFLSLLDYGLCMSLDFPEK